MSHSAYGPNESPVHPATEDEMPMSYEEVEKGRLILYDPENADAYVRSSVTAEDLGIEVPEGG